MTRLRKHLTFSNVIACAALFTALSGVAVAAKATLTKNQVKAKNIAKEAVTAPKLKNSSVISAKLATNSVIASKIANGSVTSGKMANGSVRSGQLGGGVVTEGKLKNAAVGNSKLAEGAVTSSKVSPTLLSQLVRNVTYESKESGAASATSPQSVTAECPQGKFAIGGGARIVPGDATVVQLTETIPFVAASGQRTGWTATAKTSEGGKTFAVAAYVVCAEL